MLIVPSFLSFFSVFLVAKLLFAYDIFATYLLQFYVPLDFLEPLVLKVLPKRYTQLHRCRLVLILAFRTAIVFVTGECVCASVCQSLLLSPPSPSSVVALALTVPDLSDLLSLVGAFASSMLAFVFPPLMEIVTFWRSKRHRRWLVFLPWPFWVTKDILILLLGLLGFMFGTFANIESIISHYSNSTSSNPC